MKSHLYVSTQELCDVIIEAEKEAKRQTRKKEKKGARLVRTRLRVKEILKKAQMNLRARLKIVL